MVDLPKPYRWVGDVACATLRSNDGRRTLPVAISRVEMTMAPDRVVEIMAAREAMVRRSLRNTRRPLEPYLYVERYALVPDSEAADGTVAVREVATGEERRVRFATGFETLDSVWEAAGA